jgi:hypothetical protein
MTRSPLFVRAIWFSLLFSLLNSLGCARAPVRIADMVVLQPKPSAVSHIPLRVGLRLDPSFTNAQFTAMARIVKLGEGMRKGAEESLRIAFLDVVILDTSKENAPVDSFDLIARPSINGRGIEIVGGVVPFLRCYVETKWIIQDKTGNTLYVNTFFGQSDINDRFFHVNEDMATCMADAVKQQYEQFVDHVTKANWWR